MATTQERGRRPRRSRAPLSSFSSRCLLESAFTWLALLSAENPNPLSSLPRPFRVDREGQDDGRDNWRPPPICAAFSPSSVNRRRSDKYAAFTSRGQRPRNQKGVLSLQRRRSSSFVSSPRIIAASSKSDEDFNGDDMSDEAEMEGFQEGSEAKHVETILFVECGFGADAHGQNSTKAAVRACRNAIEFNQIPSVASIVPGGREGMKLDVLLAVPERYRSGLDLETVKKTFPYGTVRIQIQNGGMIAKTGLVIQEMGDANDDMVVVCAAVTVGY